ncbi:hypothetical protein HA402_001680 [Bradysia odoriphaga]|nr:hypothetical protein HA402_001680 [Bradysia odoriphaga]
MPPKVKPAAKTKETAKPVGVVKKKVAAKGQHKKPTPVPNGEILTDVSRVQWKIGPSIGSGGFGDIYSAAKVGDTKDFNYVIKIEPHENGPLFVELHFYSRAAKLPEIEKYRKAKNLKSLGMPHYVGHGSHEVNGSRHRFVVMPRYARDVWSYFIENGKILPQPTIFRIAIQMLDVLEYIHTCEYVHADLKGANILLGQGKTGASQTYLVDFGLVSHYTTKDFKPDPKKMHNGTIEYTSRDAHNGVPTRRGDMEILAYNIIHWSGVTLPWEADGLLADEKKVQASKEAFMANVVDSLKKCFPSCSSTITDYVKYVASMKYDDIPDYNKCRQMFEAGLKKLGEKNSGDLIFTMKEAAGPSKKETVQHSTVGEKSPRKRVTKQVRAVVESESEESEVENKSPAKGQRKRVQTEPAKTPSKDKRAKISKTNSGEKTSSSRVGSTVVVDSPATDQTKSKKTKTINLNLALNVSIDTDIVVNVQRNPKAGKSDSQRSIQASATVADDDDDEDVIPDSNENTPVRKGRTIKTKNGPSARATRKSPR